MRLLRRILYLIRQDRHAAELAEEIEFHRSLTGSPAFGNATLAREDARGVWIATWLESAWQDVLYAVRGLFRRPTFSLLALGTLGGAIGLTASVQVIMSAMLRTPWPVPQPDRVVQAWKARQDGSTGSEFRLSEYLHFAEQATSFDGLIARGCGPGGRAAACRLSLDGTGAQAEYVSGNYFTTLRTPMALGRGFRADDDRLDAPAAVAVLSHDAWRRRFGGSTAIVGQTVNLDEVPFTVVGVAGEAFPGTSPAAVDVWVPLAAVNLLRPGAAWRTADDIGGLTVAGRVREGVAIETARTELDIARTRLDDGVGPAERMVLDRALLTPPQDRRELIAPLAALLAGVTLVLLVACVNIGNLLLARAAARRREIAVRASLGAGRMRLVRQLLTESLVLSSAATAVGLWVASMLPAILLSRMMAASNNGGRLAFAVAPDGTSFVFAAALGVLTCLAFGLAPALHATRPALTNALKEGSGPLWGGRVNWRTLLLGLEVAVTVVLLVAAALCVRGAQRARALDLGFAVDASAITFELPASYDPKRSGTVAAQIVQEILEGPLRDSAGLAMAAPLSDRYCCREYRQRPVRLPGAEGRGRTGRDVLPVSAAYFGVLRVPLVAGRLPDAPEEVLVNEAMAAEFWPGRAPLGETLIVGGVSAASTRRVSGVARNHDAAGDLLRGERPRAAVYELLRPGRSGSFDPRLPEVVVAGGNDAVIQAIVALAERIDPKARAKVTPLARQRAQRVWESTFMAALAGILGLSALLLSSIGLFGVFAYVVQQRTREIGVRMALGAGRGQVIAAILASALRAIVLGLVAGLGGAAIAGRLIERALYGVSPLDPLAYAATAAVLASAGLAATFVPALRAARVDPIVALRCE